MENLSFFFAVPGLSSDAYSLTSLMDLVVYSRSSLELHYCPWLQACLVISTNDPDHLKICFEQTCFQSFFFVFFFFFSRTFTLKIMRRASPFPVPRIWKWFQATLDCSADQSFERALYRVTYPNPNLQNCRSPARQSLEEYEHSQWRRTLKYFLYVLIPTQ